MTTAQDGTEPVVLDLFSPLQKKWEPCAYRAPLIATIKDGEGYIGQGCCNHWDCPRCKWTLAAYHMHRMAEGASLLMAEGPLYFWTLTCRGRDLDLTTADDHYYEWTNRLFAACRYQAYQKDGKWEYVQVTERQARGAAHSHVISTFCPRDAVPSKDDKGRDCLVSPWFIKRNVSAGLGPQCSISEVRSAAGAASYIAGYLQKQLSADVWPKHWKRVRYSRNWPDCAHKIEWGASLMGPSDWERAHKQGASYSIREWVTFKMALIRGLDVTYDP